MTLNEYNIAVDKLQAPEGLDAFQRKEWYANQITELRKTLNIDDLATLESQDRRWQDKLQSSHV